MILFFTALYQTVRSSGWLLNNVTATFASLEITSKPSLKKTGNNLIRVSESYVRHSCKIEDDIIKCKSIIYRIALTFKELAALGFFELFLKSNNAHFRFQFPHVCLKFWVLFVYIWCKSTAGSIVDDNWKCVRVKCSQKWICPEQNTRENDITSISHSTLKYLLPSCIVITRPCRAGSWFLQQRLHSLMMKNGSMTSQETVGKTRKRFKLIFTFAWGIWLWRVASIL